MPNQNSQSEFCVCTPRIKKPSGNSCETGIHTYLQKIFVIFVWKRCWLNIISFWETYFCIQRGLVGKGLSEPSTFPCNLFIIYSTPKATLYANSYFQENIWGMLKYLHRHCFRVWPQTSWFTFFQPYLSNLLSKFGAWIFLNKGMRS